MSSVDLLAPVRELLDDAPRAVLATLRENGSPRLVPVCYALLGSAVVTPIDLKPKRDVHDPLALARVRDIARDGRVSLLIDRWAEDWDRLAWARIDGRAQLVFPGNARHADAVTALRARYPHYRDMALEGRPVIAIEPERVSSWAARPAGY